ncbi:Sigma-54-dependent transcriptional regulator [Paraburkholderia unamae]|uniref:sigma 54-interacting transcriptional regulator n=1 Tax=Paraburkholderia unamae TaxID=219649 RepID=UPI001CACA8AE|nr:sigma 54-interacting transcriptional regulator [Paraburkholderia unamae]CAG9261410.1 Sigma-54-dependent transcriptional regulator [Paraburkholderia unamae]
MKQTLIGVSWVSFNNDPFERQRDGSYLVNDGLKNPGPTLEFLFGDGSPLAGRVKKHYVFVRRPKLPDEGRLRRVHPLETDVAGELLREIEQRPDAPDVEFVHWETDAPPTDHEELFKFTAPALAAIRHEHPQADIAVNLSPGTPAAQTVLLLALQARNAGEKVRAYQGTPLARRRPGEDPVREVPWNLLATIAATHTDIEAIRARGEAWSIEHARSSRLREVARLVKQYEGVPFPVLIIGARGTGKSNLARRLRDGFRDWQTRARDEWNHHLNCAEFQGNPDMLRSELFGHEAGAFTGAKKKKPGILELASGDCVFLDEIHWMDQHAQGLLLLALQRKGRIRPIGADKSVPVSFRLIAATNQSRGTLREKLAPDFLDRISDLVIELPELRDCGEDLDDIWESVVLRAYGELVDSDPTRVTAASTGACIAEFRPHQKDIVRVLRSMRLPGNYRDLERLARRLLVGGLASRRSLSLSKALVDTELRRLREEENSGDEPASGSGGPLLDELPTRARCERHLRQLHAAGATTSFEKMVEEWESRLLEAAHVAGGNGTRGAELLQMKSRTFNARLAELKKPRE